MFFSINISVYAITDEKLYTIEDEIIETIETELETNFVSKNYQIEGELKNNYLVEGGNEKAIDLLATEQNISKGTMTENSNVEGKEYDMEIPDAEDFEKKNPLEFRQFITFKTKSGKIFHIIVDHGKDSDNVMMLTEVGEQDLLNLIEEQSEVEIKIEEVKTEKETEIIEKFDIEEESIEGVEAEGNEEKIIDKPKNNSLIIIIVIALITGIVGWYFKIYKPKHYLAFEDEEIDEADYVEDDEIYDEELLDENKMNN
jgi:hypothetical protein